MPNPFNRAPDSFGPFFRLEKLPPVRRPPRPGPPRGVLVVIVVGLVLGLAAGGLTVLLERHL